MSGGSASRSRGREAAALGALAAVLGWTAVLWALALWPLPADAPLWLARTRAVCFGSTSSGLPDVAGWLVLTVQPGLMLGILLLAFGETVRSGLRRLARGLPGRAVLVLAGASLLAGLGAAGFRVAGAAERSSSIAGEDDPPPTYPRLDRPAPRLDLRDQDGRALTIEAFRGRPVLVTFAYAHCQTVCPVIVHDVLAARRAVPGTVAVIVTLDPLRDTPARLPAMARQWQLDADELVASGPPAAVEAVLDAWQVPRARDPQTGDITHPRLVYLVDPKGQIAYATSGGVRAITRLLSRL